MSQPGLGGGCILWSARFAWCCLLEISTGWSPCFRENLSPTLASWCEGRRNVRGTGSETEFNLQTVFRDKGAWDVIMSPHSHRSVANALVITLSARFRPSKISP